jgi:pre-mRNA-splicing factor ATP-dependent RNA helicase DHX15/PRP43
VHPQHMASTWCRVLYQEFVLTSKNYIRTVTDVRGEWLIDVATHYFDLKNFPPGDTKRALERLALKAQRDKTKPVLG